MNTSINFKKANEDIISGLKSWRKWLLLGLGDIRQRYSRSFFGQFWITLSMAFFVFAISIVYGMLFNQKISDYLPYICVNYIVWTFISGIIIESTSTFTQGEAFLRQIAIPKTVFILRLLVRNSLILMHNLVLVPIVMLFSSFNFSVAILLVPIGLIFLWIAGYFSALILGIFCTRFRDLPQIVLNFVQVAFFVTPVIWPASIVKERQSYIIDYNPFAAYLNILAEPLRGIVPSGESYALAVGTTCILGCVAYLLFARFRARLVYWL